MLRELVRLFTAGYIPTIIGNWKAQRNRKSRGIASLLNFSVQKNAPSMVSTVFLVVLPLLGSSSATCLLYRNQALLTGLSLENALVYFSLTAFIMLGLAVLRVERRRFLFASVLAAAAQPLVLLTGLQSAVYCGPAAGFQNRDCRQNAAARARRYFPLRFIQAG